MYFSYQVQYLWLMVYQVYFLSLGSFFGNSVTIIKSKCAIAGPRICHNVIIYASDSWCQPEPWGKKTVSLGFSSGVIKSIFGPLLGHPGGGLLWNFQPPGDSIDLKSSFEEPLTVLASVSWFTLRCRSLCGLTMKSCCKVAAEFLNNPIMWHWPFCVAAVSARLTTWASVYRGYV